MDGAQYPCPLRRAGFANDNNDLNEREALLFHISIVQKHGHYSHSIWLTTTKKLRSPTHMLHQERCIMQSHYFVPGAS
jgi:hypothetical protein